MPSTIIFSNIKAVLDMLANERHKWLYRIFFLVALSLFALLIFAFIFHLWKSDFRVPFIYSDSDVLYSNMVVKTVLDTGWFHRNPYLGAPGESHLYDYFQPYGIHFLTIKLIGIIAGGDWAITLNLFILLSFLAIVWSAWFLFKSLGMPDFIATCASILFALLPYHTLRLSVGHLFLSSYFIVPLAIWLALQCAKADSSKLSKYQIFQHLMVVVLLSNCGIYYALFGCYALLIGGILGSVNQSMFRPLKISLTYVMLCAIVVFLTMMPSIRYLLDGNSMEFIEGRHPSEAEIHGMKLIQLLLPISHHRIVWLSNLAESYNSGAPLVHENSFSSLGLIGSIGFILLMFSLIVRKPLQRVSNHFENLSLLTFGFFMLGTIGGIGSIIAWTASPTIRAYNRVSIFIACLSLAAAFLLLHSISSTMLKRRFGYFAVYFLTLIVTILGIMDITSQAHISDYSGIASRFHNDQVFVSSIEKKLPDGAMVFQTPHISLPATRTIFDDRIYSPLKGYLHSRKLHWSYGTPVHSEANGWMMHVDNLPPVERINALQMAGFSGIYVDRLVFHDHGVELENGLRSVLSNPTFESSDGNLAFYKLTPTGGNLPSIPAYIYYKSTNGFWAWEGVPGQHIWSKGRGEIELLVMGDIKHDHELELSFFIHSLNARKISIFLNDQPVVQHDLAPGRIQSIRIKLANKMRRLKIRFETNQPAILPSLVDPTSTDGRSLAFAVDDLRLHQLSISE